MLKNTGLQTLITALLVLLGNTIALAQGGTQVEFGQNRVQYDDFEWQSRESDYFITYFYPGGQELARFIIVAAEEQVKQLEARLNFSIGDKIEILIYKDITDLSQTNIGISENKYNVGGTNNAEGTKLFLYFDGNHNNMLKMLKKELAIVFLNKMMSGRNFADLVKNVVMLDLPEWYTLGVAAFLAESWNTELDDQLRRYWTSTKKPSFQKLIQENQEFAGHSLWHYVFERYGENSIKNLIYLTRIHRSVNKGFSFALGKSEDEIIREWEKHNQLNAAIDLEGREQPKQEDQVKIKLRKNKVISRVSLSPNGDHIAYSVHKHGQYKVFIKNLETGKKTRVITAGFNSNNYPHDHSYPIFAWHPSSSVLTTVYEKRSQIKQVDYDVIDKKKSKDDIRGFHRVFQVSYAPDGRSLVFSAQNRGQTDIYTYHLINRTSTQINRDIFDDSHPTLVDIAGTRGVVFSSNRPNSEIINASYDTILPSRRNQLYFYNLQDSKVPISKLSENNFEESTISYQLSEDEFVYLSNKNGISNLYRAKISPTLLRIDTLQDGDKVRLDSIIGYKATSQPLTNLYTNIQHFSLAPKANRWAFLIRNGNSSEVYISSIPAASITDTPPTNYRKFIQSINISDPQSKYSPSKSFKEENKQELEEMLTQEFQFSFNSKFDYTLPTEAERLAQEKEYLDSIRAISEEAYLEEVAKKEQEDTQFKSGLAVPYRARFSTNFVTTQLDNSVLPFAYESVALNGSSFEYPNLGGMIMYGIQDLMEDHKLVGGFRFPIDFKGSEVFLSYENLKKRLDKRILFYRKSSQENFTLLVNNTFTIPALGKKKTNYIETRLSYPFDVTKSLRLYAGYRNDRLLFGYTDTITMIADIDRNENWSFLKLEFVHDNSKEVQPNIFIGFRYKFYTEYFKNWSEKKSNLFTFGYDIRHYTSIFKNIIWANRLAGASSWGHKKIRYYIGGTDTWLNNKYDNNTATPNNEEFAFQAHATSVRGFPINIRNGSSNLVFNSELRVPIFSLISKKRFKSPIIQNFQIAGFFDIGSAYNGLTPFNQDNPFITEQVTPGGQQTPVVVNVKYYRNPTVMGTGFGVRTILLGYFMKLDWAWGIDGGIVERKPMWMFSLSKDF